MAVKYVKSTTGSDVNGGTSWVDAYATVAKALSVIAAGDTVYVSQAHAETQASAMTWTSPGTVGSPVRVLCVNDGATPPTAMASGATVSVTGNFSLTFSTGFAYVYGISFSAGSGNSSSANMNFNAASASWMWTFELCNLALGNTNTGTKIIMGVAGTVREQKIVLINTTIGFGNASQVISPTSCRIYWYNTPSAITGTTPTTLFSQAATAPPALIYISGVDLSALGAAKNLFTVGGTNPNRIEIRNCKINASVNVITGTIGTPSGSEVFLDNCDSGNVNYRMEHYKFQGKIVHEIVNVFTSGASDGTTPIAHKFVSLTTGPSLFSPLEGPWMAIWNELTGSSKTITVEFLHDSVTNLQNSDIYLEVEGLGTASLPQSVYYNSRVATVFATPADCAAGAGTGSWTTTSLTNPNSQKLTVSFTPQIKGLIRARVCLVKANYTVFVNPLLTVS